MGQLTLTMKYRKNEGMILSPTEILRYTCMELKYKAETVQVSAPKVCASIYRQRNRK